MRVLIADDDEAFRAQLAELVTAQASDAEVIASVADGNAAVVAAMESGPALVLIDYAMPGPNGGHAAAVIKQALPATRVVILSGLDRDELVDLPPDTQVLAKGPDLGAALAPLLAQD